MTTKRKVQRMIQNLTGGEDDDGDSGVEDDGSEGADSGIVSDGEKSKVVTTLTSTMTTLTTALSTSTSSGGKVSKKKRTPLSVSAAPEEAVTLETTGSGW